MRTNVLRQRPGPRRSARQQGREPVKDPNRTRTGSQLWEKGLGKLAFIIGDEKTGWKPSGFRKSPKDGRITVDQKLNRFLKNFGDLGQYQDEKDSYYKGWTGMKPIYEMKRIIDGTTGSYSGNFSISHLSGWKLPLNR